MTAAAPTTPSALEGVRNLNNLSTRYIVLTAAEVKNLRATGKILVPAPGAGMFLEFVSAELALEYGSEVFTESSDDLSIVFDDAGGAPASESIDSTGFLDQTEDTELAVDPIASVAAALSTKLNKALVLDNTGDGEIAGNASNDSKLHIWITFRTHDTKARIA